ncbi:putative lipoprotein [Leptospira ryugenii]|uniref:Putative lipoprotein n=1 Tax=Leptospira ryugenii TaxID=1917863 RepID=A0A2P2E1F2_9LEPT|nr:hypothetical protein [Leptospira ryugenii]GBF50713.1 putative lipoprotein [Leptospira ryugenii]
MILKFKHLAVFFLVGCSTVDFIPDPDFRQNYPKYQKKTWEEVELQYVRPNKPFVVMGEIIVRNQNGQSWRELESSVKRELWERKLDGAWMTEKRSQKVDGFNLETQDSRGHTTNSYKDEMNLLIWKGIAYRYR